MGQSEPEDREVEETRDVSDVPEDEVNETVDEMLTEDDEAADADEDSGEFVATDTEHTEPQDLTAQDPDDISIEELESQEWTLGEEKADELIEFKGTKFLLTEPDDDDVLDIIAQQPGQEIDAKANMLKLVRAAVAAPEITDDRWENQMNMSERLGLTMRVSQYIGIDDFMDFPEGGAGAQPGM